MLRYRQPSLSVVWINSINFDVLARVIGLHSGRGFRPSFEGLWRIQQALSILGICPDSLSPSKLVVTRSGQRKRRMPSRSERCRTPRAELSARTTLLLEACPIYEQKRRSVCFVRLSMGKLPVIC